MTPTKVPATLDGAIIPGVFLADGVRATADNPVNELRFTAVVTIDKKDVSIRSGNLLNLAKEGLSFELPSDTPIKLGNLQELVDWAAEKMNIPKPDWSLVPDPLNKITTADVAITELRAKTVKQGETPETATWNVTFAVAVEVTFQEWNIIGNVSLKSFTFALKREQVDSPSTDT